MVELKVCPFCGGTVTYNYSSRDKVFHFRHITNGGPCWKTLDYDTSEAKSLVEMRDLWNRREDDGR